MCLDLLGSPELGDYSLGQEIRATAGHGGHPRERLAERREEVSANNFLCFK